MCKRHKRTIKHTNALTQTPKEWTNEREDNWEDERLGRWMNEWKTDEQTKDRRTNERTNGGTDGRMDGWIWLDGWMNRRTDGRTDDWLNEWISIPIESPCTGTRWYTTHNVNIRTVKTFLLLKLLTGSLKYRRVSLLFTSFNIAQNRYLVCLTVNILWHTVQHLFSKCWSLKTFQPYEQNICKTQCLKRAFTVGRFLSVRSQTESRRNIYAYITRENQVDSVGRVSKGSFWKLVFECIETRICLKIFFFNFYFYFFKIFLWKQEIVGWVKWYTRYIWLTKTDENFN